MVAVLGALGMGAGQAGVFGAIQPLLNIIGQKAYQGLPNQLASPDVLVSQRIRNMIPVNHYFNEMVKLGFNRDRSELLYQVSHQLLNGMELIALRRRDMIDEEVYSERMGKVGWDSSEANELLEITQPIPSTQDVIMFAVREVYQPDIAEQFGQFEGGEDTYNRAKSDLDALGMTKARFMKYWAAHWMLPSIQQGFEMLHRNEIDEGMLDNLMIAADIMPAWRKPLKEIAYHPYTRVDVRRMHKFGVLSDDDLIRAYLDLGFNHEKADTMARFTIEYNNNPPEIDTTELDKARIKLQEITRDDILKGYYFKLMTRPQAKEMLIDIGLMGEQAEFHLAASDFDAENDELETHLKILHDGYIRGVYDRNTVVGKAGRLDLPGAYVEYILEIWDIERSAKTRQPSKAELLGWMKRGQITEQVVRYELDKMGYPDQWINLYIASSYERDTGDSETRERDLTKTEALRAYKKGFIDWSEAAESLIDLDFSDDAVDFYRRVTDMEIEQAKLLQDTDELTPDEVRVKVAAKTDILKSYVTGIIEWREAENRLKLAKFTDDAIEFYKRISDVKKAKKQLKV